MGRQVNARPVGVVYKFVPECLGNAEDPDPVIFHIKPTTERDKRRIADNRDYQKIMTSTAELVKMFVVKVENYSDANGRPIEDGKSLFENGESEFIAAAVEEIMSGTVYDEEEKKSSES